MSNITKKRSGGGGEGSVLQITGNSGVPVTPDGSGNINLLTANTNVNFDGIGNTMTLDFGASSNLILGSSPSISGLRNCAFGVLSLANLTTGSDNLCLGYRAGYAYQSLERNNICLNNEGITGDEDITRIGNDNTQLFYAAGIVEQVITNETLVVIDLVSDQVGIVPGKPTVTIMSPLLDMLGGGTREIFTPQKDFVIQSVVAVSFTVADMAGDSSSNLGFTGPNYTDYINAGILFPTSSQLYNIPTMSTSNNPVLPTGTPLVLNMTSPDTGATVFEVFVYVTGFYL